MIRFITSFFFILILISCNKPFSQFKDDGSVKIIEIVPDPSQALEAGSSIKFNVKVEYSVKGSNNTLSLVLQDAKRSGGLSGSLGSNTIALNAESGNAEISHEIIIPDTHMIQIFTPISSGNNATAIVDSRNYNVIKK